MDETSESLLLDNEKINKFFDACVDIKKKYGITVKTCGGYAYCSIKNKDALSIFAKGCGIEGANSFVINNAGDIRFCGRDNRTYGNIFKASIFDIRKNMELQNDFSLPQECKSCQWKESCRGGCHMSSYAKEPSFNNIDANAQPKNTLLRTLKMHEKRFIISPFKKYVFNANVVKKTIDNKIRYSYMFFSCIVPNFVSCLLDSSKTISLVPVILLSALSLKNGYFIMEELIKKQIIKPK